MTIEDLLLIIENEAPSCGRRLVFTSEERYEAYRMAQDVLVKQLPMKPIRANYEVIGDDGIRRMLDENEFWKCPSCAKSYKNVKLRPLQKYCHYCGQTIGWSDKE